MLRHGRGWRRHGWRRHGWRRLGWLRHRHGSKEAGTSTLLLRSALAGVRLIVWHDCAGSMKESSRCLQLLPQRRRRQARLNLLFASCASPIGNPLRLVVIDLNSVRSPLFFMNPAMSMIERRNAIIAAVRRTTAFALGKRASIASRLASARVDSSI